MPIRKFIRLESSGGLVLIAAAAAALLLDNSPLAWLGVALLSGIGFTMSLFIGTLAFDAVEKATAVRLGVIVGSLLAGVFGYLVLHLAPRTDEATVVLKSECREAES